MINTRDLRTNLMMKDKDGKVMFIANTIDQNN